MTRPTSSISSLDAHLGYWLRFVSNQVSSTFGAKVATHGVSVAEWVVLRKMYNVGSLIPSVLAEEIGLTRGGLSKIVDRLIDKKLITRTTSDEDRRYQTLALTPKGRTLVPVLASIADQNDAEFFGHLTDTERFSLKTAMQSIVERHHLKSLPTE